MGAEKLRVSSLLLHAAPSGSACRSLGAEYDTSLRGDSLTLLEHRLALLHGTEDALVTSSRLSALGLVTTCLVKPGDNLVAADQISGETYAFFDATCRRFGCDVRFVTSPWEPERWEERVDERTQLLFAECPSDPNMFVPDLEPLASLARGHYIPLVVDTTVATGALCRASDWGAEIVVSSVCGDLTGDATRAPGGAVMGSASRIHELRAAGARSPGGCMHPCAASMALVGLETLMDRLRTKHDNTVAVRSYLLERRSEGDVTYVNHPSLRKHPQHDLARKYMKGFAGALVGFGVPDGEAAAAAFVRALRMIALSHHPGGSRTTIAHPFSTTHAALSPGQKSGAVIQPNALRLCIGNEDPADILEDLERGFAAI